MIPTITVPYRMIKRGITLFVCVCATAQSLSLVDEWLNVHDCKVTSSLGQLMPELMQN